MKVIYSRKGDEKKINLKLLINPSCFGGEYGERKANKFYI